MNAEIPITPLAATSYLAFAADGTPHLVGSLCADCGCVAPGPRMACAACCARGSMKSIRLAERGRLHSFTIVHRSFPGVTTPFVAAVVELDGGAMLKGTLVDIEPRWEALAFDMPVQIVFRDTGQRAPDGRTFISYYFSPAARPS